MPEEEIAEATTRWSDNYAGRWKSRAYMIVPMADIDAADGTDDDDNAINTLIDAAIQSGKSTLRKSVDGTKALLKFSCDCDTADHDADCFAGYDKYSQPQILAILAGEEWTVAEGE